MTTTVVHQPPTITAGSTARPATPHESGWHFPGPSSRYHTRERSKVHLRSKSNISQSVAPNLQTEQRAHRRARSSYTAPLANERDRSTAGQRFFNAHSRRSLHIKSPIQSCSPLSRFPSFDSSHVLTMDGHELLSTPAKSPSSRQHSILQDSPFSDYFTDDGRSIDGASQPPIETHQLLVRLNKLQSALMRGGNDSQALHIIGRRMNEIENDMDSLHSQSRQPPELDDSGLFLEEAEEERCDNEASKKMKIIETNEEIDTAEHTLSARDTMLLEQAHDVLASITQAQQNLQQRFNEMQLLRAQHSHDLEEKDALISKLRNQLDHVTTDREMDHSELLLYRSHIVHFVNQAKEMRGPRALDFVHGLRSVTRDWQETLDDMDRRRRRLDAVASDDPFYVSESPEQRRWTLQVSSGPDGKTQSITVQRTKTSEPTEKNDSKLINYINSVEQIIRDETETSVTPQHSVNAATQTERKYVDATTQTKQQYINAATQTENVQQPSIANLGIDTFSDRLFRMSIESRDVDQCSQDYDDDDDSFYYRRPVLSPPDDDDVHSCAITTTPASEADPDETLERGTSRFMDIMSDFLDDPSEDEAESEGSIYDHAPSVDIDPQQHGRSAWDELWDSLAEYAGVGGR